MTVHYDNFASAAKEIVSYLDNKVVLGIPLGIGKPIGLVNALYQLALGDSTIELTIITGLTLARPTLKSGVEQRLVEPILDRVLGDYEDPLYESARVQEILPPNIRVIEFYFSPGKFLRNKSVQRDYISSFYTDVANDLEHYSVNVIAHLVSKSDLYPNVFSIASNTDLFLESKAYLSSAADRGKKVALVAEVNPKLPFMVGSALAETERFSHVIDTKRYRTIFAVSHPQLSAKDHLIGLYTSALVKDDGCLQLGIGKMGDAVAHALIVRHNDNHGYRHLLDALSTEKKFGEIIGSLGGVTPFSKGLYASTEMFSDAYMHLYLERVLRKKVYDHAKIQELINQGKIDERVSPNTIDVLIETGLIGSMLSLKDFEFLQKFGVIKSDLIYENALIITRSGEKILADFSSQKQRIIETCLGMRLKTGKILHAGFFLGTNGFYEHLRKLPAQELQLFDMTSVKRVNALDASPELLVAQRQNGRFINSAMMVTLTGAVISDGLSNWQEVSGVGGQFDFAYMTHRLPEARLIINCAATRQVHGRAMSNIVWNYPNITLPRYLRDIVVTEYGIADCKHKTDADIVASLLSVTDSRFQQQLLKTAKQFGKIAENYEIPKIFQNNYPEASQPIVNELRTKGYFHPYPFGSDLTNDEEVLQQALLFLKGCSRLKLALICLASLFYFTDRYNLLLARIGVENPKTIKDVVYKNLVQFVLRFALS
jgi:acyl-CoA hydrolase